ncbi:MAG: hypothetical protein OZ921_17335 [Sorangiineae bacterium]|nr:hypothetical protein [Polyangiaceae bacterium]MEB2324281.1 hypothetical protein [Sorangiineae bacterium]
MTLDYNAVRYDRYRKGGHVESYFFKLNDPAGRRALWLKATILARLEGRPVAEAWAIAFDREREHVAVKEVTRHEFAEFSRRGLEVRVAGVHFSEGRLDGRIESPEHTIEFGLDFDTASPPLAPLPSRRLYEDWAPNTKLVSPHPNSRFSGSYSVDGGAPVAVEGWRGMQGHNWGSRHTERYAWTHVNQWDGDEEVVLEAFTGRVKVGPLLAPPLTVVCVWHRGTRYEFNRPRELVRSRGRIGARSYRFEVESALARASGELHADTRDFVGLYYENPNREMTYCLNSKIASGTLRLEPRGRPALELTTRAGALELGTKDEHHGVSMLA